MAFVPEGAWVPERLEGRLFWPLAGAFAPLRGLARWPTVDEVHAAIAPGLANEGGLPIRFERQAPRSGRRRGLRCRDALYDARIDREGVVPTRERSWHDLFNALVWAAFPRAKAALAWRQHRALQARLPEVFERLPSTRTAEQDALTLLDEGGALVVAPREACDAVSARLAHGELTSEAGVVVFGHAVYEHALSTDAPLRVGAHLVAVDAAVAQALREGRSSALAEVDRALAEGLRSGASPCPVGPGLPLALFAA